MSHRFKICLIAWIAVVAATAWSQYASAQTLNVETAPQSPANSAVPVATATPASDQSVLVPQPSQDPAPSSDPQPAAETQPAAEPLPVAEGQPAHASHSVSEYQPVGEREWAISIVPAQKLSATAIAASSSTMPVATCVDCENAGSRVDSAYYTMVYNSIPFNRAEYNVNPSYRHDSTMEILTGNARHRTILRHGSQPKAVAPVQPVGPAVYPATFIRPGIRLNYYRYFPSLSPYMSWWNYNGVF